MTKQCIIALIKFCERLFIALLYQEKQILITIVCKTCDDTLLPFFCEVKNFLNQYGGKFFLKQYLYESPPNLC